MRARRSFYNLRLAVVPPLERPRIPMDKAVFDAPAAQGGRGRFSVPIRRFSNLRIRRGVLRPPRRGRGPEDGRPGRRARRRWCASTRECLTGDVFHSLRCDCRRAARALPGADRRGGPRPADLRAQGRPRHRPAEQAARLRTAGPRRRHGRGQRDGSVSRPTCATTGCRPRFCSTSGCTRVRLLSNNPKKIQALERAGVQVVERIPCEVPPLDSAEAYLRTKKEKLGHLLGGF